MDSMCKYAHAERSEGHGNVPPLLRGHKLWIPEPSLKKGASTVSTGNDISGCKCSFSIVKRQSVGWRWIKTAKTQTGFLFPRQPMFLLKARDKSQATRNKEPQRQVHVPASEDDTERRSALSSTGFHDNRTADRAPDPVARP